MFLRQREALVHKLMQIKPGLSRPVLLRAAMIPVAARNESTAGAWGQQADVRGGKGTSAPSFFSRQGPGPQLYSPDEKEILRKPSALWVGIETMWCVNLSFNRNF